MDCLDENMLAAYADGELAADQRALVDRHIDGCAGCRAMISDLVRMADVRGDDVTLAAPPTFETAAMATLDKTESTVIAGVGRAIHIVAGTMVGEYEVTGRLGEGGMGAVFSAIHPRIGKRAAIKVLLSELARDPQALARFENEARAVNAIGHPNIVDIFGFGELADGNPYCVMAYVEGENLQAYLDRHGRLSLAKAMPILRPICDALSAAHQRGIVHRDIKPGNVMIAGSESAPRITVLDFGLAKIVSDQPNYDLTDPGVAMGTPLFMSPEQHLGEGVDHRTDIYALGVLIYQMVCGCYPYSGATPTEVGRGHFYEIATPPSQRVPELPTGIDPVLAKALAKDPRQRFASIDELLMALEQCLLSISSPSHSVPALPRLQSSPPVVAHPRPAPPLAVATTDRRKWLIGGALAAAFGVAVLAASLVWRDRVPFEPTVPAAPREAATAPSRSIGSAIVTPIDPPPVDPPPVKPPPIEPPPIEPVVQPPPVATSPPVTKSAPPVQPTTPPAVATSGPRKLPRRPDAVAPKPTTPVTPPTATKPTTTVDDDMMLLEGGKVRAPK